MKGTAIHGDTPFDVPFISEIAPNLWQGGCQHGLMLPEFIKHLISLYPWEKYKVQHELSSALTLKMYDSLDQSFDLIEGLAVWLNKCRKDGPALIHCQAGLNRSSLVSAYALMLEGKSAEKAIETVRAKRSRACLCNKSFEEWLLTRQ
jgi:protein-tyrosine phosphatase